MTPGCEVDVPVVELEGDVAGGVGEVPAYGYSEGFSVRGYGRDVEELSSVELDSWEKENCCFRSMF